MNFYTVAARIDREIEKAKRVAMNAGHDELDVAAFGDNTASREMTKARRIMGRGIDLMLMFKEVAAEKGLTNENAQGTYLLTLRPADGHDFDTFYATVQRFVQRNVIVEYTATFEQKGTSTDTLGHGFHTHIVIRTSLRSKADVLRAAQSTFKHMVSANNVDVRRCTTPQSVVENYFVAYKSDDGHKEATREWDAAWRSQLMLQPLYTNDLPDRAICLTSPGRQIAFE